ncbi:MAG: hypothetical protein R2799_06845 [Crocinitomicaceae bacterium]
MFYLLSNQKDSSNIQQIKYGEFHSNTFTLDSTAVMFEVFMRELFQKLTNLVLLRIILESSSSKLN